MVIVRFHRKLHPKRELNSFVHQNIICRLSYESLKHPNHALLASESPAPCQGRCHMPLPPPWNFSQDLAWFLSLGGKFCASSWWKAVGGVVWGSFLATILRKCDLAIVEREALASAKPIVYAPQTQKTSKKTAVSTHKKWRTSLSVTM